MEQNYKYFGDTLLKRKSMGENIIYKIKYTQIQMRILHTNAIVSFKYIDFHFYRIFFCIFFKFSFTSAIALLFGYSQI